MRCPNCKQTLSGELSAFRPFCSERCKLLDLGRWLDGSYAIPGEPIPDEESDGEPTSNDDDPPRY